MQVVIPDSIAGLRCILSNELLSGYSHRCFGVERPYRAWEEMTGQLQLLKVRSYFSSPEKAEVVINVFSLVVLLIGSRVLQEAGETMCEMCYVYDACSICGKDSSEVDLAYEQDVWATMLSETEVGYWHCEACEND